MPLYKCIYFHGVANDGTIGDEVKYSHDFVRKRVEALSVYITSDFYVILCNLTIQVMVWEVER